MDAYNILENELDNLPEPPESLLDIGISTGYELSELVKKFHALGVGVDPFVSESLSGDVEIQKKSAEEIDQIHMWFDAVFSVRSFHHFNNPKTCLEKLKSVIGWQGRCFLIDYHKGADTGFTEHYYSIDEASEIIEDSGLVILDKKCINDYFLISATLSQWKIAVSVNTDKSTIFSGMFGQAPLFAVYNFFFDRGFELSEFRTNIFEKTLQHQKTLDVYKLVNDCQVVVSAKIGEKGIERLENIGVKIFFETGEIKNILEKLDLHVT